MLDKILYPIRAFKLTYLSLMAVYFSVGFGALANVTNTFFVKNNLTLDPADLISIGIWASLPWSIKMIFGSLIDSVNIFGNNRKNYIYLGNLLIIVGTLGLVDHSSTQYIMQITGEYMGLVLSGLITTIGIVLADIVADTMAIELTNDPKELGDIQVLSRLALSIGAVAGASMAGYLATTFEGSYHYVYLISLICPVIAVIGTYMTKLVDVEHELNPMNWKMLGGGLLFGAVGITSGMISKDYGTLIMFTCSSVILAYMFRDLLYKMDEKVRFGFALSMLAIFLFRVTPGIGAGIGWFYMDVLGLDAMFFGKISLVGNIAALLSLWFLMEIVAAAKIFKTILILTVIATILSLPELIVYYGYHEYLGIAAKNLILIDGAISSPIANLAMVPLGVLVAKNKPTEAKAVYITVTAGLMNLALVGGDVMTELLNKVFVVTRGEYSQLGELMIWSLGISTALSIVGLILLKKGDK